MLRTLLRRGTVEKVARGLYRLTDADPGELESVAAVCARAPRAIACLLTALQIHGIGTRLTPEVWIGLPHGSRPPRTTVARIRAVRFSDRFLTVGVSAIRVEGVPARITDPSRTIVDCLRLTALIDRETAFEALREGLRGGQVSPSGLLRTARLCGVHDRVRGILEILTA